MDLDSLEQQSYALDFLLTGIICTTGLCMGIVGCHALRSAASLAASERVKEARTVVKVTERMLRRARLIILHKCHSHFVYKGYRYIGFCVRVPILGFDTQVAHEKNGLCVRTSTVESIARLCMHLDMYMA